jgi:formiminotetrahydrofolate cyclodeaminase
MDHSFATFTVVDLLEAFSSGEPVPGGGSAAALAGALGVSLLMMVAKNPKSRTGAPEEIADLAEAAARLGPLRETLLALVDDDTDAYRAVVDAMNLPKGSDTEKARRRDAIALAMRRATEVPLETMRVCQQALRGAVIVASNGNLNAASDAGVGIALLDAALRGAAMNIAVNVRSLTDQAFVERVDTERRQLEGDAAADARRASAAIALSPPTSSTAHRP